MLKALEIVTATDPDLGEHWDRLVARSEPNVFMHPAATLAARECGFSDTRTLLAWDVGDSARRLVGLWSLARTSLASHGPRALSALPFDYAFVSNPVVDVAHVDDVIPALIEAIKRDESRAGALHLKYLDADSATAAAIERTFARRGNAVTRLSERERPFITREHGQKLTGSTRKKLKQDWNRLGSSGRVDIINDAAPASVAAAFEEFLALEAASWKGEHGTALLSRPRDAAFARRLIANLAEASGATVALLRLNQRTIAAQVLLQSGPTAYTWKTAYDAAFAKFSPGALLVDQLSQQLLSPSGGFTQIESCSPDGGFMEQLWSGRRRTVELLVNLGPRQSLGYLGHAAWHRGRRELKQLRDGAGTAASLLALLGLIESP